MKKRMLSIAGATLCAVIVSASVLTVKNRAREGVPANAAQQPVKRPKSGEVYVVAPAAPDSKLQDAANERTVNVPEYVVYWHLFRSHNSLTKQAAAVKARGEDATFIDSYYQREANLDDRQSAMFAQIATQCELDVNAVDAEAKLLIGRLRAQNAGAQIQPGQPLPPLSPELLALQQRRNNIVLQARDQLQRTLGQTAFTEFQEYVREKVTPQIKPKSLDTFRLPTGDNSRRQPRVNPPQDDKK